MAAPKRSSPATAQQSREVAEAAREENWQGRSFARELFNGRLALELIHPHPEQDQDERDRAAPFLAELEAFARDHIDGDAIDRDAWVPEEVLDGLRGLGCFGIKIPREYGGLGFSQVTYSRALSLVASRCGSTGAFLSAHQSIGVPQPLLLFGTEDQKRKYLPRLAKGALSAFALTEPEVGSDPANLSTWAHPSEDGEEWVLNGEKLWCTNGPRAELMVVMARTPARDGVRGRTPITAFIVENSWPGVEVLHTCHFMGLRGISNGVIRFNDVRVPRENILWGEGQGLKLALITLNTGRLSLPAFCASAGKLALEVSSWWADTRVQWGKAIGKHDAIAQKLGRMAADTFAMEAVVDLTSAMADGKTLDIRLEAAIAKMWHSETAWRLMNDALQIRGGRGYETASSLEARGELPVGLERAIRDLRINLIFEGTSEVMRLFIAREAVDQHLKVAGELVDPRAPVGRRARAAMRAGAHYAWWYPSRWFGGGFDRHTEFGRLARHVRYLERGSRRLSRNLFHAMARHGGGLENRQAVLGRLVDVGAELFVMSAACVRAAKMLEENPGDRGPEELADLFCRQARRRIRAHFRELFRNEDVPTYRVAQKAMAGDYEWLGSWVVAAGVPAAAKRREDRRSGGEGQPETLPAPPAERQQPGKHRREAARSGAPG